MNNTTSVAYINKYGVRNFLLNVIAREMWQRCIDRHITLSAYHLCGTYNNVARQPLPDRQQRSQMKFITECVHTITSVMFVITTWFICIKIKSHNYHKLCVSHAQPKETCFFFPSLRKKTVIRFLLSVWFQISFKSWRETKHSGCA